MWEKVKVNSSTLRWSSLDILGTSQSKQVQSWHWA